MNQERWYQSSYNQSYLTISWFVSYNLGGVLTWTSAEVLLISFEGCLFETCSPGACRQAAWPKTWKVPLWAWILRTSACWSLMSPHSFFPTPTDFTSKFTDLLTPSFISELAFFRLTQTTILWVLRRIFEGISRVPFECARSSRTFASSVVSWNLWTLFEVSGFLVASSTNTRNSPWASFVLPHEPKIDDLILACATRMQ